MISILLALVLFFIQIPIKTTILALKAGKGIRNSIKKNKQINEQYEDDDSLKGRLSKIGKKTKNTAGTVAKGAKETVKTGTKSVKGTIKGVKKTAKAVKTEVKVVAKTVQLLIKVLKLLLMLIKALITFLLSLGVVGIIILVVILLIFAGAVASSILVSMDEDKKGSSGSIGPPSGEEGGEEGGDEGGGGGDPIVDTSSLEACCKTMAEWYIANVPTYQGRTSGKGSGSRTYYACSILDSVKSGATAGDDCTGFSAAYASLVAKKWVAPAGSSVMYNGSSSYTNAGWKKYTIAEIGGVAGLKVGDILVCNSGADKNTKGHHAEIFLGTSSSFGWGKIQSKYPSSSATFTDSTQHPGYIDQGTSHRYGVIYRYTGG